MLPAFQKKSEFCESHRIVDDLNNPCPRGSRIPASIDFPFQAFGIFAARRVSKPDSILISSAKENLPTLVAGIMHGFKRDRLCFNHQMLLQIIFEIVVIVGHGNGAARSLIEIFHAFRQ